jgi:uncharacterized lipoprotein YmbA
LAAVDGFGSGLDADTVDGQHASAFVTAGSFDSRFDTRFQQTFQNNLSPLFGTDDSAAINGSGGAEHYMASVYLTAANFPPPGTAFAAGQTMSITLNSALFSLLGTTYGGDGVTTFKLPDLRKQAPGGLHYVVVLQGLYPSRP